MSEESRRIFRVYAANEPGCHFVTNFVPPFCGGHGGFACFLLDTLLFFCKKIQWRKMPTNEYFEDLEGMSLKFLLVWSTLAIDLSTHNTIEKPLEIFL